MPATRNNDTIGVPLDRLNGLRVLLVEDSWHLARALKWILEDAGLDVTGPAATISDAEALILEHVPDLAVVDLNLQGTMAHGLIDKLIEKEVPIIVVTGYEVLPELEGRVAAILSKPVRASVLLRTCCQILAKQKAP